MKVKLYIGDDSGDGHGKYETIILEVNKDVSEIRQAYKDSCRLVGVQFNHGINYTCDNTKLKSYRNPYHIWCEYEDYSISEEAMECLIENKLIEDEDDYYNKYDGYPERFIMDFIKLSIPDLEYNIISDDIPVINSGDLNHQFGYGLFD